MGRKSLRRPALPKHKRCHKGVDSRPYYTDAMRAFDLGRGGYDCPQYMKTDYSLWLKYCGGRKQRRQFLDAMRKAGGAPTLTEYEAMQEEQERLLTEANASIARRMLEARGVPVTPHTINNLIRDLQARA